MIEYPAELAIQPLTKPVDATVSVPGSKSITNRALVLAAMTPLDVDLTLRGALHSEDTEVMVNCLKDMGYLVEADWPTQEIRFPFDERQSVPRSTDNLFVANSGTTMRFLAAMVASRPGRFRFSGIPRMHERPIKDLLDAINQLEGVKAVSEKGNGCPPVIIESTCGFAKRPIKVRADVSSQFLSALLLAAPHYQDDDGPVVIEIDGPMVSEPYVDMTLAMLRQWEYTAKRVNSSRFEVENDGHHNPMTYHIEPDASSASYFFAAAAITGGRVTVTGMKRDMLQGDVKFVDVLERMGCRVEECDTGITVHGKPLTGIDIDMNAISDTVMTLAAVACFAEGPTTIRNVAHIRHKETDRIAAVATELRKLGAEVDEYPDGLKITPLPMTGCAVETYNDHRMAMSLALIGLKVPGVIIKNPGCVAKTYPGFWQDFEKLRN
jgi:3-phosphoshikimate 1-carboxyvinyltransferase